MSGPIEEAEVREAFRWILDEDPRCPLTENARRNGSENPSTAWLMAGYLIAVFREASGRWLDRDYAYRVASSEIEARWTKHLQAQAHLKSKNGP